jgi:alanine dehydrogenase
MRIGMPRETKVHERRVGMTPAGVRDAVALGHEVFVEAGAGAAVGFSDANYKTAGARVITDPVDVFSDSEIIVKVKEPQAHECEMLGSGQALFTFLHLAADRKQTELLLASRCTAIAYETVTDRRGGLPLLALMSESAGRMAAQVGAHCLENPQGGAGVLMSGVSGVPPAKVVVLGGDVTVLDRSVERLRDLDQLYGPSIRIIFSSLEAVEENVRECEARSLALPSRQLMARNPSRLPRQSGFREAVRRLAPHLAS